MVCANRNVFRDVLAGARLDYILDGAHIVTLHHEM